MNLTFFFLFFFINFINVPEIFSMINENSYNRLLYALLLQDIEKSVIPHLPDLISVIEQEKFKREREIFNPEHGNIAVQKKRKRTSGLEEFICPLCKKRSFISSNSYRKHLWNFHQADECSDCDFVYECKKNLILHYQSNHEKQVCFDNDCDFVAHSGKDYEQHLELSHPAYLVNSNKNSISFSQIYSILKIFRNPTLEEFKNIKLDQTTPEIPQSANTILAEGDYSNNKHSYKFHCPGKCSKTYTSLSELKQHSHEHHQTDIGTYSYYCLLCNSDYQVYRKHFYNQHAIQICQLCSADTIVIGYPGQKAHYQLYHQKLICPLGCKEIFLGYTALKNHVMVNHSDDKDAQHILGKTSIKLHSLISYKKNHKVAQ